MTMLTRYYIFGALATLINLGTQHTVFLAVPVARVEASILAGTLAGFAFKYLMDKYHVFQVTAPSAAEEARRVLLYALLSVGTTLIFWFVEVSFWILFRTDSGRYAGAVLGLAAGYTAKYWLDKRYVFQVPRLP
jgi:putative flippase GtrA